MLELAGIFVRAFYVLLPVSVLLLRIRRARLTGRKRPLWELFGLACWGLMLSIGLSFTFAFMAAAYISVRQVLIGMYFCVAMLIILRTLDGLLVRASRRFIRPRTVTGAFLVAMPTAILRVGLLFAIGLPYVMSTVMIYRPKVLPGNNPGDRWGVAYQDVSFPAVDGTRIAAWWIPASVQNDRSGRTVIVCHGLGSSKSNHLSLGTDLYAAGYNILAIDFRAHGESAGQLSTFGDRERADVLGAVRWLMAAHPGQTKRIYGVGASLGAAALIAAAGDASVEGQRIDAVAVYGTYDSLRNEIRTVMKDYFPKPLGWLLENVGVPMASLHVGRNLKAFAPVDSAQQIWPRPLLVIHGTDDEIIRFEHGQRLFQQSLQPKQFIQIEKGTHNGIIEDQEAHREVLEFFDNARSLL